jgi:Baseplate J-like protein
VSALDLTQSCDDPRRRAATAESAFNGIDFLEVDPAGQRTLRVHFLHPLPGEAGGVPAAPALTEDNVRIEGGVRIRGIAVDAVESDAAVLTVTVDQSGDFSNYVLRLVASPETSEQPAGFDPALAAVSFSFKVTCPTTFDCRAPEDPAPAVESDARIDYLARDYDGFLRLALDRLAVTVPDWQDNHPADPQTTLLELLAYVADHLSYQQDARANEAYLGTARSRISASRHARLLDYRPSDGCSARAWVTFEVLAGSPADGGLLEAGRQVLTGEPGADPRVAPSALAQALRGAVVFETLTPVELSAARSAIPFHTWSDAECTLPAGATAATLVNDPDLALRAGDVLLLEEVRGPLTGLEGDADPRHRHPVRLTEVRELVDPVEGGLAVVAVRWDPGDALPFALQLTSRPDPGLPPVDVSVARGNVALADHGLTLRDLPLGVVPADARPWRPPLPVAALTRAVPLTGADEKLPAAAATALEPGRAVAALRLTDGEEPWDALPDLLGAAGDTSAVVVELERDGGSRLRFGDGVNGRRPGVGTAFALQSVRTGVGAAGNVGHGVLARVVTPLAGVTRVDNPLPASGGADAEDIESIRRAAPAAFRVQQRAVTEADWVEVAQRRPDVQRAAARIGWRGSWYVVTVLIDRIGGLPVVEDARFLGEIEVYLDRFRVAGYDLTVRDPLWVPLDLAVRVCVDRDHFRTDVERRVRLAVGPLGLFHPDRLTFGQPVFASAVVAAAMGVEGVTTAEVTRFQQFGKADAGELAAGVLAVGALEVARLDDDRSFPERGRLELTVEGGR